MSLIVTKGYGNPGSSGPSCLPFYLDSIDVYYDHLDLNFNNTVVVGGLAEIASNWTITGGLVDVFVTEVSPSGSVLRLDITEPHANDLLTLHIPFSGLIDIDGNVFNGPFEEDFLAVAVNPEIFVASPIDSRHLRVVFTENVIESGALTASNYVITGSPGLNVYSVSKDTDNTYIVTTSPMTTGATYTLTVSNVQDDSHNDI